MRPEQGSEAGLATGPASLEAFQERLRQWLEGVATPRRAFSFDVLAEGVTGEEVAEARRWQARKLAEGWGGLTWPVQYGGQGLPPAYQLVWNREVSRFVTPEPQLLVTLSMAAPTLMAHGSEAQKEWYLPRILRGEDIWCQLFSEPSAGSDLAGLRTEALRADGGFVVTGQKTWSSGAHHADYGLLVARTDKNAEKHAGLSYFILPMNSPGVTVRPLRQMTGGAHFNEVFFEDVFVGDDLLLGGVGEGWKVARSTLNAERFNVGTDIPLGIEDVAEVARALLRGGAREPDGERAARRQAFIRVLGMAGVLHWNSDRVMAAVVSGQEMGSEGIVMKMLAGRFLTELADVAVSALGNRAMTNGNEAEDPSRQWVELLLGAPAMHIAGGTDEILKTVLGERVLGLPKG